MHTKLHTSQCTYLYNVCIHFCIHSKKPRYTTIMVLKNLRIPPDTGREQNGAHPNLTLIPPHHHVLLGIPRSTHQHQLHSPIQSGRRTATVYHRHVLSLYHLHNLSPIGTAHLTAWGLDTPPLVIPHELGRTTNRANPLYEVVLHHPPTSLTLLQMASSMGWRGSDGANVHLVPSSWVIVKRLPLLWGFALRRMPTLWHSGHTSLMLFLDPTTS